MRGTEISTVWLDSMKVAFTDRITGEFMAAHARLEADRDPFTDQIVRRFTAYVRAHNLPPEQLEETHSMACHRPSSWWQTWKHDVATKYWALRWIVRWRPVKTLTERHTLTVTFNLRRFRVYPDAPNIGALRGFAINYMNHNHDTVVEWITDDMDEEQP